METMIRVCGFWGAVEIKCCLFYGIDVKNSKTLRSDHLRSRFAERKGKYLRFDEECTNPFNDFFRHTHSITICIPMRYIWFHIYLEHLCSMYNHFLSAISVSFRVSTLTYIRKTCGALPFPSASIIVIHPRSGAACPWLLWSCSKEELLINRP